MTFLDKAVLTCIALPSLILSFCIAAYCDQTGKEGAAIAMLVFVGLFAWQLVNEWTDWGFDLPLSKAIQRRHD